jgi:MarR family transcriptional regulator, lower aerobic nicotinate degradation pathway regulator
VSIGRRSKAGATGGQDAQRSAAPLDELYGRPGFMLRRAHQIAVALFLEETGDRKVTTSQYGALFVLAQVEGLDLAGLGRRLGMDRSTSALVVSKLQAAGWVAMATNPNDRRRKALKLTPAGQAMLDDLAGPAHEARERLLSPFTPEEAETFLRLLERFVAAFNGSIRTPIAP